MLKWGVIFRKGSCWIGWHYSPGNRRWCINLIPFMTIWITKPGGKTPHDKPNIEDALNELVIAFRREDLEPPLAMTVDWRTRGALVGMFLGARHQLNTRWNYEYDGEIAQLSYRGIDIYGR